MLVDNNMPDFTAKPRVWRRISITIIDAERTKLSGCKLLKNGFAAIRRHQKSSKIVCQAHYLCRSKHSQTLERLLKLFALRPHPGYHCAYSVRHKSSPIDDVCQQN